MVLTFLLDSDTTIGNNVSTTNTANVSLKKVDRFIDGSIVKVKMNGTCTDAGRGGTRDGLALDVFKLGRTMDLALFIACIFCLRAMNLMMCSPL